MPKVGLDKASRYAFSKAISEIYEDAAYEMKNVHFDEVKSSIRTISEDIKDISKIAAQNNNLWQDDIYAIEGQADAILSISRKAPAYGLRSWDSLQTIANDAEQQITAFASYWKSQAKNEKIKNEAAESSEKSIRLQGPPAYRFNVGDEVKINGTRKHGRVIQSFKENGNGRQMYEVKLYEHDKTEILPSRSLQKVYL